MPTSIDPALSTRLERLSAAGREMQNSPAQDRARWLCGVADALDANASALVELAHTETHLPDARLRGELVRTTFQARLFAERLQDDGFLNTRIDQADDTWPMGPRPDIRRTYVPIGPVVVFAASNFPFAFSVFGGDTVSALAAGCPVMVKAHPGHLELSRKTAEIVADALTDAGAPDGVFAVVAGDENGAAAVQDRRVKAAAFTGSTRIGRLLFNLACNRPDPIPFYGELGSTNPVVVTPAGWSSRADEIAAGFAASFTLGSGQFCTKPGVIFVPDVDDLIDRLPELEAGPMLNDRIVHGFDDTVTTLREHPGISEGARGNRNVDNVVPELLRTTTREALNDPQIIETECFGPAAIACEYRSIDEVATILEGMQGTLTGTVQGAPSNDPHAAQFIDILAIHAGRVIWNQWPTGVTVTDAQQHGGPWPATTAPTTTSVGTAAIERFVRPIAFQNVPPECLPAELQQA